MTDVNLSVEKITRQGIDATDTGSLSASNNYFVPNDGRVFLHFKKSGAGVATISIVTPGSVDGLAITDLTVSVPATTGDVMVGPFPPRIYNDANGKIEFTSDDVAGLSVACLRL